MIGSEKGEQAEIFFNANFLVEQKGYSYYAIEILTVYK